MRKRLNYEEVEKSLVELDEGDRVLSRYLLESMVKSQKDRLIRQNLISIMNGRAVNDSAYDVGTIETKLDYLINYLAGVQILQVRNLSVGTSQTPSPQYSVAEKYVIREEGLKEKQRREQNARVN